MTIKIITKINKMDWSEREGGFIVPFKKINYNGSEVDHLFVKGKDRKHYYNYEDKWVKMELDSGTKRSIRFFSYSTFDVKGDVPLKTFEWPNELRFRLKKKDDKFWENGIELDLAESIKFAEEGWICPGEGIICSILIKCPSSSGTRSEEQIKELSEYLKEGGEYVLKNFSGKHFEYNECNKRLEITSFERELDLAEAGTTRVRKKSKWEVQKELRNAASNKIDKAIQRAKNAWKEIVEIDYKVKKEGDLAKFNEAVMAASELMKIAKYGSETEKEVFNDHYNYNEYTAWNGDGESFKGFKDKIHWLSVARGWKYDFENPASSTNQPTKTNDNSGTNEETAGPSGSPGTNDSNTSDNGKKRKNDGDSDSREAKRLRTEEVKNNVKQSVSQKNAEGTQKLNELLSQAEATTDYEELKSILQKISKYEGEEFYIAQRTRVNEAKNKLGGLDENKFRNDVVKELKDKLAANGIDESKLNEEERKKFNQLKNGEFTDVNKINEAVNELSESANKEGAKSRLSELLAKAEALVKGTIKGSIDSLKKQAKEVQEGLYSFVYGTNSYQKDVYQTKQGDIKSALEKLENHTFRDTNQTNNSGFFRPEVIVPISLVAVALIGIATAVIIRKRKQNKLKK